MNHQHEWAYTDQGVHWCSLDYEPDCTATEIHDVPCDHPEEHEMDVQLDRPARLHRGRYRHQGGKEDP